MKASIFIRYFCGSVAVLLLWQLGSVTLGSDILPDPLRALGGFWDALKDPEFIGHIGLSLYRTRHCGFLSARRPFGTQQSR